MYRCLTRRASHHDTGKLWPWAHAAAPRGTSTGLTFWDRVTFSWWSWRTDVWMGGHLSTSPFTVSARTMSATQHVQPPGFCHCRSVRLEHAPGPWPQPERHRSFQVPAKDVSVRTVLAHSWSYTTPPTTPFPLHSSQKRDRVATAWLKLAPSTVERSTDDVLFKPLIDIDTDVSAWSRKIGAPRFLAECCNMQPNYQCWFSCLVFLNCAIYVVHVVAVFFHRCYVQSRA